MKHKKVFFVLAAAALILVSMTGCGSRTKTADDDIPTITWYLRYENQAGQEAVSEAVNEITEKHIGARVEIKRYEPGDYNEKIKLALSAGETMDICHMAPRYGFYTHVAKNAFMPLDELIKEYAQETYNDIPEEFWKATKINGKIYGIPNYQIVGRTSGFVVLKSLLDKYNFDLQSVEKLEDIEPLFAAVKNGESSAMQIFGGAADAYEWGLNHYVGFETIGSAIYPTAVRSDDETLTVVNQFDTEEFKNYCKLMRDWYQKGYIAKQGSSDSLTDLNQQGLVAVCIDNVAPGFESSFKTQRGGRDVETKIFDQPYVDTSNVIATMNCVGMTSKYPEKAVQFINLVDQNVDNIYNILCYGIEGVNYNKVGENRIEKIENSGYDPNSSWEFGNNFNAYLFGDQEDDVWEQTKKVNEEAKVSNILGFSLDTEPIKTELASCNAVVTEYLTSLTGGTVDPETLLPEFNEKLKMAGVDTVIEETQRQIDEWKSSKDNG